MALSADFFLKRFEVLQEGDGRGISSICSDSRQAESGSLFVALKGRRRDGHQSLDEAVQRGAAALLLERRAPWPAEFKGAALKAPDTRSALSMALNEFYGFPSRKLFAVGITGTNGKTTVSYMLEWIFNSCGWPAGVIGTIDQHFQPARRSAAASAAPPLKSPAAGLKGFSRRARLTTPEPVELFKALNEFVKRGARAMIMEASSIGLDQKRAEGIDFRGAVFTNLTPDHLDYHLNMDNYFRAKKRLFELTEAGPPDLSRPAGFEPAALAQKKFFCLINKDDKCGEKLLGSFGPPYYSYGRGAADFCFEAQSQSLRETVFLLRSRFGDVRARLPLPGIHNVYNAAAAIGSAVIAGFSLKEAARALESFPGVPGRLQKVSGPDDLCHVFVDYAHAPLALRAALQTLKPAAGAGRLIAVFGCGGERDRQKRPDMVRAALEVSDFAILTSDNPRHEDPESIIKEALRGADKISAARLQAISDRREAIQKAIGMAKKGDIVLIAGKGHEAFQIIGGQSIPFDDRETARELLKIRRG